MSKNNSSALDASFRQLWQSFAATYGSLRLFSEQLPSLADRLDEQTIEELSEIFADIFNEPMERIRTELRELLPALDNEHLSFDLYNDPEIHEAFQTLRDIAFRRQVLKWERENPHKKHRFLAAWTDYMAQPPLSGIVLRQSALINLVSVLEIFVDGVAKIHHEQVDSQRSIKDRSTWQDRWKTLEDIAASPLWQAYRDPLREIIARRNALIHQGGRITTDGYLKQTEEVAALRPLVAAEGRFLLVPTAYLQEAFNTAILFIFALTQSAWRTWRKPRHSQIADKLASDFIYQTLRQKRYPLVERLTEIALAAQPGWKYRQIILVNWAIACREQNKPDKLNEVLTRLERRKKHRWEINMAIHILHQRFDKAETLMKEAAKKGKLAEASPYWPLFDPVREETWFKNLFNMPHGTLPHSKTKRRA